MIKSSFSSHIKSTFEMLNLKKRKKLKEIDVEVIFEDQIPLTIKSKKDCSLNGAIGWILH